MMLPLEHVHPFYRPNQGRQGPEELMSIIRLCAVDGTDITWGNRKVAALNAKAGTDRRKSKIYEFNHIRCHI